MDRCSLFSCRTIAWFYGKNGRSYTKVVMVYIREGLFHGVHDLTQLYQTIHYLVTHINEQIDGEIGRAHV